MAMIENAAPLANGELMLQLSHPRLLTGNSVWARLLPALLLAFMLPLASAKAASLDEIFAKSDEASVETVDHSVWNRMVGTYLRDGPLGVALFDYAAVTPADKKALKDYLEALQKVRVTGLSRKVQMPYWINLYNALTVDVILDHYPVESIRDIKSGLFSTGPWGEERVTVEGNELSLDHIEHEILRPIWRDKRIHYVVNCASIGCPNLAMEAYTEHNTAELLDKGARDYINSPRGVRFDGDSIIASKLFTWYDDDFGDEAALLAHLREYASPELKAKLDGKTEIYDYEYDWALNAPR